MKTNYHCHTYRCGHASGNEEEMIQAALKANFKIFGFSEHVPLPNYRLHLFKALLYAIKDTNSFFTCLRTIYHNGKPMRCPYNQKDEHLKLIKELKEKYKDKIDIIQGFEAEYLEEYLDYYKYLLENKEVDYLILGHHFNKYCIHNRYNGKNRMTDQDLYQYCEDLIKAMKTGLFTYIAHPDLFLLGRDSFDQVCQDITYKICYAAKEYDIPLEINGGGIRRGKKTFNNQRMYPYTNPEFFKIVSKVGNKVIIGIDCHNPNHFNDGIYEQLIEFSKEYNLNLITKLEIK